jgi:hypothetical protein
LSYNTYRHGSATRKFCVAILTTKTLFFSLFFSYTKQENRSCLEELVPGGGEWRWELVKEGEHGTNAVNTVVNGKMVSAETIPGNRGHEGMQENGGGVNSSMTYLIYCKNFCKCHNVPAASTTIKKC